MAEESVRTRNKAKTQQRVLAAARELFYGGGVCATGVSAVAERAGVTKMTLYAHFPSKEELVTAYLEDSDRRWREFLEERLSGYEDSRDGLLAICDAYREYFTAREVRGCAFVKCAVEFPDPDHPARRGVPPPNAGGRGRLWEVGAEARAQGP